MKKAILSLVTFSILGLVFQPSTLAASSNDIQVTVDGKKIDFPDSKPFLDHQTSRTMVPVRFVSQSLGATVDWDQANQTVKMSRQGKIHRSPDRREKCYGKRPNHFFRCSCAAE